MTLVYLIAGTFNAGGMERVLANKVNWLVAHGYDVSVVTTDQRGRAPYFELDKRIATHDLGINYDADNGRLWSKLLRFPIRQWRHKRRLGALLQELKPDITVCMFNNDVNFVHGMKDGSRKVLEVHFSKNKKLQYGRQGLWATVDRWRTQSEEQLVDKYDHFVVLTHEDCELWGNKKNITVIPNARTFVPTRRSALTEKRVVAIGRYDRQKGFDTLLNIWHQLRDRLHGWTLDIVGDGPQRDELTRQAEQLQLTDSVRLLKPTDDIESIYLGASILAMTSRYEGLPMVLLEAQACGLPMVAFACQCGPRDVIHDGEDGFLVPTEDVSLFATCLLKLMTDEGLRMSMGEKAAAHSEAFSEERVMGQWERLFSEIKK